MTEVLLLILAVAFFARRGRGVARTRDALPGVLEGAVAAGIITTAQREQLLAYAATHEPPGRLGGVAWLGVFAGLFVVAGVALLIARNWEDIGPLVRVGAFVVVLAGVGEAAIRTRDRPPSVSVPVELCWLFLPLLGIGLYGQTFQLSGDPIQPFLVWLALTAPLAWLSPRPIVAIIHTFALVAALFAGNFVIEPANALLMERTILPPSLLALTGHGVGLSAWAASLAVLVVIALQNLRLLPPGHRHHFVGVVACWLFVVLVGPTPLRIDHEGWIVVAALALATLWIVVLMYGDTSIEERAAAVFVWLTIQYALTFTWHIDSAASGNTTPVGLAIIGAAIAAGLLGTFALPLERLSPFRSWALGAKAMLAAPLVVALLYLHPDVRFMWCAAIVMNGLLLVIAVGAMWHGSLVHEAAQVNLGVMLLVGLLITRFIDVFGNMLRSGVGFIVAGLLLAGLSWGLDRTRRRLIGGEAGRAAP
jgi:uncharacterized membrane protein